MCTCVDVCANMCVDKCVYMCVAMCAGLNVRVDMCAGMDVDMCVDMSVDMRVDRPAGMRAAICADMGYVRLVQNRCQKQTCSDSPGMLSINTSIALQQIAVSSWGYRPIYIHTNAEV